MATEEMLWIEHEGNIYRGYSQYYPLKCWNPSSKDWRDCSAGTREEGWGNVITEDEAAEYMVA